MRTIHEKRKALGQSGGANVEPTTIDKALGIGMSPQSVVLRYVGLSCKAIQRHGDERHHETTANVKRSAA